MQVKIVQNIEEFEQEVTIDTDIIYLTSRENKIRDLIANSKLDDEFLYTLKLAYDVQFDGYIEDITNEKRVVVHSLFDTLTKIENIYDHTTRLIIDTKSKELLADVMQQFIYLDFKMYEIVTKEELTQYLRFNRLHASKQNLKKQILLFKGEILKYNTSNLYVKNDKRNIIEKIEILEQHLKTLEARKLNISAMATKKSGKSVIINSFLKNEYAPTSLILATPNSIVYTASDEDYIQVRVEKDETIEGYETEILERFHSPEEVRDYTSRFFKKAEEDSKNNFTIPDIYINYPKGDINYTIIDTPGPDAAGTDHAKKAYSWIDKSDAVIFAIDFTKYLNKPEEEFLKEIKTALELKRKFHSFIVVVNKMDMRYQTAEKKSIPAILDFLKDRLLALGYGNIPILGISAQDYFAALEFQKILQKNDFSIDGETFLTNDLFEELRRVKKTSTEKTTISIIKKAYNDLRDFHEMNTVRLSDIEYNSGIPALIQRTKYITTTKASVEIFNNVFEKMNRSFKEIKDGFIAQKIEDLLVKKDAIVADLDDVENYFKKKEWESKDTVRIGSVHQIEEKIDEVFNEFLAFTKQSIGSLLELKKEKIKEMKKKLVFSYEEIAEQLAEPMNDIVIDSILAINTIKNDSIDTIEREVMSVNNSIKQTIKEKKFETKYGIEVNLSELDPALARENFELKFDNIFDTYLMGDAIVDATEEVMSTKEKISYTPQKRVLKETRRVQIQKYFQRWRSVEFEDKEFTRIEEFKEKQIEHVVEKEIVVNIQKLNEKFEKIEENLIKAISKGIEEERTQTKEEVSRQINKFNTILSNELNGVISSYRETNENIRTSLAKDKKTIEDTEEFYNEIESYFDTLENSWTNIVKVDQ